jgi:predicted metal-dependent phosphotriesterase family hydrolase
MSNVRTVLGDVAPETLGVTYCHEHLIIDAPLVADRFPHISLPSVEEATAEVGQCAAAGVGAMLDAMPCAAGRRVDKLVAVSRATGVHVIAATGLHTARYYDPHPWTAHEPADVLAELFTADVLEGIDRYDYTGPVIRRTPHRAGVVKVATLDEQPTDAERRLLAAAAETHRRTGAPILTHCQEGRGGLAQVAALTADGVPPAAITLSHTDKHPDPGYHRELLASGVHLVYDQSLREPERTLRLLEAMLAAGFGDQLLLGTDGARRSLWATLGGSPGLAWLASSLPLDPATRHALLVTNPARALSLPV